MYIGIYIYDQVEVLDFAGPYEVFTTAARLAARQQPDAPQLFQPVLIADTRRMVTARGEFRVQAHYGFQEHPPLTVLLVPGGVHTIEIQRPEIIAWMRKTGARVQIAASVCTGAFFLAQAGMLNGLPATTHWEDIPDLRLSFPEVDVREGVRWVDSGRVVTSAGISAGIDMSLHLVARLADRELALKTAQQMEFDWSDG
ncbi:MAG: DJ-1/PfpI family protein [Anaerolineales bacterium]|jgi:transcriptional regulator GlxA family with amidase domain